MSFNSNKGRQSFSAAATQTAFAFNFKIYSVSDVKVYLTHVGQNPNDVTDILIYGTDYTVVIDGDNGGTITLLSGATLNDTIVLERQLPRTRATSYVTNGDLKAVTLNEDQNYQTYMLVDALNTVDRAITLPSTDVDMNVELPTTQVGQYLKVKADGSGFEYVDIDTEVTESKAAATSAAKSATSAAESATSAAESATSAAESATQAFNSKEDAAGSASLAASKLSELQAGAVEITILTDGNSYDLGFVSDTFNTALPTDLGGL